MTMIDMYESVLAGATAGFLAAVFWHVGHHMYRRYCTRRELNEFGKVINEWMPGRYFDDNITDSMQYRIVCESRMQRLSKSHIKHPIRRYLWHNLRREIIQS